MSDPTVGTLGVTAVRKGATCPLIVSLIATLLTGSKAKAECIENGHVVRWMSLVWVRILACKENVENLGIDLSFMSHGWFLM
ncbi:hypothetical protein AAG906_011287 [Vitis piasezkii]